MPASNTREINGIEISGTPAVGDIPIATSAKTAVWASGALSLLTGAVVLAPTSGTRNVVRSTGDFPELTLMLHGSQTANMLEFRYDAGTLLSWFDASGLFHGSVIGGVSGSSGSSAALLSATTVVNVSSAVAPSAGQVLTATNNTHATWQTPSGGFTPNIVIRKATTGAWTVYTGATAISTAVAAASPGDLVWVGPGTFNDKNFLKNGVNLWFEGSSVVYAGAANGAIFDDGANGANGAVTCTIGGYGSFTNSGSGSGNFAVNLDNASTVTITAKLLQSTVTDACELNAGTLIFSLVDAVSATGSNKAAIYVGSSASLSGRVRSIAQTNGSSGWGLYSSGTTSLVCEDISAVGKALFSDFGTLDVDLHTLASSNNIGIHINGAGAFRISANAISTGASGTYPVRLSNGTVNLSAKTIVSGGNNAALWLNGATAFVSADKISTTSAYEPAVTVDGGTSALAAKTVSTTSGSQYALGTSGGTVRLLGGRFVNTGTNGIAVQHGGGTHIWEGACSLVSHSGATDSYTASGAQTAKNYGTLVGNKAFNALINIQVSTSLFPSDANVV